MNCKETQQWLDAYCDGELDTPRSLELEQHLDECRDCAGQREQLTVVSKQIRAAAFNAPEHLQQRIRTALRTNEKGAPETRRASSWPFWASGVALAASVVLAFVFAQTIFRPDSDRLVLNEIVDSHLRSLVGNRQVDVTSSDQHTVRPWFEGKVDFAPVVPDLSSRGFELMGGRLDYIHGHPAATLVYKHRKHYISLFVWPSEGVNRAVKSVTFESEPAQRGYQVLKWKSGSMSYWAISEISLEELRDFARAFTGEEAWR